LKIGIPELLGGLPLFSGIQKNHIWFAISDREPSVAKGLQNHNPNDAGLHSNR
jgi:hypothetical protein